MLKEIVKVNFSSDSELDLGNLDPSFDAVLARGDYHVNFAGYDQGLAFGNLKAREIMRAKVLALAM